MTDATDRYKLLHQLTPGQSQALELIDAGASHQEAADSVGVDRTTVSRWAVKHPSFVAELNYRKTERAIENNRRVQEVTSEAVSVLADAIGSGDVSAAVQWLKLVPVATIQSGPIGPTSVAAFVENRRWTMPARDDPLEMLHSLEDRTEERAIEVIFQELEDGQ